MNHSEYLSSNQLSELMWISALRQALEKILAATQDKSWRKRIKTCYTLMGKLADERWEDLSPEEQVKQRRRIEHIKIKIYSYDDNRYDRSDYGRTMTIGQSDFLDLIDAATLNCMGCPQGDLVKECPRRKMFHRLGLAVHALRENPEPGQCEFRSSDEQYAVTPQYIRLDKEIIEQLP